MSCSADKSTWRQSFTQKLSVLVESNIARRRKGKRCILSAGVSKTTAWVKAYFACLLWWINGLLNGRILWNSRCQNIKIYIVYKSYTRQSLCTSANDANFTNPILTVLNCGGSAKQNPVIECYLNLNTEFLTVSRLLKEPTPWLCCLIP